MTPEESQAIAMIVREAWISGVLGAPCPGSPYPEGPSGPLPEMARVIPTPPGFVDVPARVEIAAAQSRGPITLGLEVEFCRLQLAYWRDRFHWRRTLVETAPGTEPTPTESATREPDMVNHTPHYNRHPSGIEAIQVCEHFGFNIGNVIKYCWLAEEKGFPIQDLAKARWYLDREIAKRKKETDGR